MQAFIELGGVINGYFTRNKIYERKHSSKAISNFRKLSCNKDAYYCTYIFDNIERSNNTKYISPLYFDIDGDLSSDIGFNKTKISLLSLLAFLTMDLKVKSEEIKLYFSGGKGFHVFINPNVINMKPSMYLHQAYKLIANHISKKIEYGTFLDTKIYDCKRLIRLPNSINAKTGYYKIPILLQDIQKLTLDKLLKTATTPQLEYINSNERNDEASSRILKILKNEQDKQLNKICFNKKIIPIKELKLPLCIKEILITPVEKGNRNNTLIILISTLIQHGYSKEKILNTIYVWNSTNNPPLSEKELILTYNSAERMAMSGRGYGCSSILEYCNFNHNICTQCPIFKNKKTTK